MASRGKSDRSVQTYPVILVGGDGGEFSFGKDERLEVLRQGHVLGLGVHVDGVKARLILVHRVEYYLPQHQSKSVVIMSRSQYRRTETCVDAPRRTCPLKPTTHLCVRIHRLNDE